MKKLYFTLSIIMLCFVSNAQSPYYYYYEGNKIYLSLNTRYAFLSIKEPSLPDNIKQYSTKYTELKPDNLNEKKSSRF
jgi:hypothetical protein